MTIILVLDSVLGHNQSHYTDPDYPASGVLILNLVLVLILVIAMILTVFLVLVLELVRDLVLSLPFLGTDIASRPSLCNDTDLGSCPVPGSVSAL